MERGFNDPYEHCIATLYIGDITTASHTAITHATDTSQMKHRVLQ